jgi:hypothetical protein
VRQLADILPLRNSCNCENVVWMYPDVSAHVVWAKARKISRVRLRIENVWMNGDDFRANVDTNQDEK